MVVSTHFGAELDRGLLCAMLENRLAEFELAYVGLICHLVRGDCDEVLRERKVVVLTKVDADSGTFA